MSGPTWRFWEFSAIDWWFASMLTIYAIGFVASVYDMAATAWRRRD